MLQISINSLKCRVSRRPGVRGSILQNNKSVKYFFKTDKNKCRGNIFCHVCVYISNKKWQHKFVRGWLRRVEKVELQQLFLLVEIFKLPWVPSASHINNRPVVIFQVRYLKSNIVQPYYFYLFRFSQFSLCDKKRQGRRSKREPLDARGEQNEQTKCILFY